MYLVTVLDARIPRSRFWPNHFLVRRLSSLEGRMRGRGEGGLRKGRGIAQELLVSLIRTLIQQVRVPFLRPHLTLITFSPNTTVLGLGLQHGFGARVQEWSANI